MLIIKQDLISPAIPVILINESESSISGLTGVIGTIRNFYEILELVDDSLPLLHFNFMQEISQEKNIDAPAPDQQPKSNNISVKKLWLRHNNRIQNQDTEKSIKDLTLEIIANEKVGIPGKNRKY